MKSNVQLEKEIEELKTKLAEIEDALCDQYKELTVIQIFIKNEIANKFFVASLLTKGGVKPEEEVEFYKKHAKEIDKAYNKQMVSWRKIAEDVYNEGN